MHRGKVLSLVMAVLFMLALVPSMALAIGGPSGPKLDYGIVGKIGEVVVNPYGIAPLTAVIKNGGYYVTNAKVTIVPKAGGQTISYAVNDKHLRTHGGIPIFGLYPDYVNTVEVEYDRTYIKKTDHIKESYKMYAPAVYTDPSGLPAQKGAFFGSIKVTKVDPEFKDRLYFVNNIALKSGKGTKVIWNNPAGGALEWNYNPEVFIIDTTGTVRWYMLPEPIYTMRSAFHAGVMMGFRQNIDGAMSWGYGQRYAKYDIIGREIFNRELPASYNDFSHFMYNSPDGHYFLRVASADYKRPDGKNVRTVRDVIIEVDENGNVVDDWKLFDILDPYRSIVIKVLDEGAVCLNIDASQAGHTISAEELAKLDKSDRFGDIVGVGPGRNWAHVNSVYHDTADDSIIISSRHQSAVIKIGRDKQVKWILGSPEGWKPEFLSKFLTPVDSKGNKLNCQNSKCTGTNFDYPWTQHTAFKIDSMSKGDILYLSIFDNGDARGMEQPALPTMKYSRAVIYKIDQKKKTVDQIWEYGKERGYEWYSSVTSLTEYQPDKNSIFVYSATAGMQFDIATGAPVGVPSPELVEFKWMAKEPSVQIRMTPCLGYQAFPFSIEKAFSK